MDKIIIIIALGWIANLFVHFWIDIMSETKSWITAKPWSCESCMGFWIGSAVAFYFFPVIIWWECFLYGYYAAGTNWLLNKIVTGEF